MATEIRVRRITAADMETWIALRLALWPWHSAEQLRAEALATLEAAQEFGLLAEDGAGAALGLLELSLRPSAQGASGGPVPYVEGWYVVPAARRQGVGRALLAHAEAWAVAQGYDQMGSDTIPLDYPDSAAVHQTLGFALVGEGVDEDGDPALFFYKRLE